MSDPAKASPFCGICGHPLRFMGARLATVSGYRYHAACWILRGVPSAQTNAPVN